MPEPLLFAEVPVHIEIPPSPSWLPEVRRAAKDALRALPSAISADLLLALDEAVSNAIRHGSPGGRPVEVGIEIDAGTVEIVVVDRGPTWHLPSLPEGPPALLSTGGRGLWLILQLVDEVRLQRLDTGTRLELRRTAPELVA